MPAAGGMTDHAAESQGPTSDCNRRGSGHVWDQWAVEASYIRRLQKCGWCPARIRVERKCLCHICLSAQT